MSKNKTISQHIVPAGYLRHFQLGPELYVLDIDRLKNEPNYQFHRRAPGSICWMDNYYTIRPEYPQNHFNLKVHDSHFIEDRVLKNLEDKYPVLFNAVTVNGRLTAEEAIDLCDFIIAVKLRNPYWLKHVVQKTIIDKSEQLLHDIVAKRKLADPMAAAMPDWIFEAVTAELLRQQQQDPNYAKQYQLYSLRARHIDELGRNARLREKFIDASWTLYSVPTNGPFFFTTDNPGGAIETGNGILHNIKLQGGFTFYFPLSYKHLLVVTDQEPDGAYTHGDAIKNFRFVTATAAEVPGVNLLLSSFASQLLIAADRAELIEYALRIRAAL